MQSINANSGYLDNLIIGGEAWISGHISNIIRISPRFSSAERRDKKSRNNFYSVWLDDGRFLQVPKNNYVAEWVPDNEV